MGIFILIGGIIGFIGLCMFAWSMLLEWDGEYHKAIKLFDIGTALMVIWAIAMIVIIALIVY